MLLGCGCQCTGDSNQTPSESELASASTLGSGSDPDVIAYSACSSCVAGVGPTAYQCTWAYGGTTQGGNFPCCGTYAGQSVYKLYRRATLPPYTADCCIWGSNEPSARGGIINGQPACIATPSTPPFYSSRIALYMGNVLSCFPSGGISTNLKLRVWYEFRVNAFTFVEYVLPISQRTPPYNCLQTFTLEVVKVPHKIFGAPLVKMWSASGSRDYGIGPCWSNDFSGEDPGIPDTVTLTAVPL